MRCTVNDRWGLQITNLPGRLSRKLIEVSRVEELPDGTFRSVPWSRHRREHLASVIEPPRAVVLVYEGEPEIRFAPNLRVNNAVVYPSIRLTETPLGDVEIAVCPIDFGDAVCDDHPTSEARSFGTGNR
jgi:hypothetical protein